MGEKICVGCRIPKDLILDIQKAMKIMKATSISYLLKNTLREYLKLQFLLSDRIEKVKRGEEE